MPLRYAHHVILLVLIPAIALAFWPHYFGDMRRAPFAFHAHGLTASCWILLVMTQSWTAHARAFRWHRLAARSVLILVPLFAAGGALAIHSMATKFVTKSDPFYGLLGARLGMDDLVATIALVLMVRAAVVHRRRVALHANYMLATVLLVLSPIMARLPLPRWWHLAEIVTLIVALALYAIQRRNGLPFLIVAGLAVERAAQFETIAASDWWATAFGRLSAVPPVPFALIAFMLAGAAIWTVWPWRRSASGRPLAAG